MAYLHFFFFLSITLLSASSLLLLFPYLVNSYLCTNASLLYSKLGLPPAAGGNPSTTWSGAVYHYRILIFG